MKFYPRDASFLASGGAGLNAYAHHAAGIDDDGSESCFAACSRRIMVLNGKDDQGQDAADLEEWQVCQRAACLRLWRRSKIFARAKPAQ